MKRSDDQEQYYMSQAGMKMSAVMVALYHNDGFFSIPEIMKLSSQDKKTVRDAIYQFMELGGFEKLVDGDKWGMTLETRQMIDEMQARMGRRI
jgi:hypothetical protein